MRVIVLMAGPALCGVFASEEAFRAYVERYPETPATAKYRTYVALVEGAP